MQPCNLYFKEEKYYKNKFIRFLILFLGEALIVILILIISQLLKDNGLGGISVLNYLFAILFIIVLIFALLFSWGGYLMQIEVRVNKYGISRIFKMPPLIKREKQISKDAIQNIYWHPSKKMIYENGQLQSDRSMNKKIQIGNKGNSLVVFESYNGGAIEFETLYPEALEKALSRMFMRKGS